MRLAFSIVLLVLGWATTAVPAAERPNIVHIVADDLGWKDVGFNGATDLRMTGVR